MEKHSIAHTFSFPHQIFISSFTAFFIFPLHKSALFFSSFYFLFLLFSFISDGNCLSKSNKSRSICKRNSTCELTKYRRKKGFIKAYKSNNKRRRSKKKQHTQNPFAFLFADFYFYINFCTIFTRRFIFSNSKKNNNNNNINKQTFRLNFLINISNQKHEVTTVVAEAK